MRPSFAILVLREMMRSSPTYCLTEKFPLPRGTDVYVFQPFLMLCHVITDNRRIHLCMLMRQNPTPDRLFAVHDEQCVNLLLPTDHFVVQLKQSVRYACVCVCLSVFLCPDDNLTKALLTHIWHGVSS